MATLIKNIIKKFDDFLALDDINVEIREGEFVAILGPSGCGKTTLLRLLAGFIKPTSGTIEIEGDLVSNKSMSLAPEERNISMVFQNFALWPHMTVKDHIKFPILHHKYVSEEIKKNMDKRVTEVLESIGLATLGDRLPGQLSGGQKQRVALGRAIAPEPKLLLMDEPLSSLDAELRMEMRREIQKLHRITKASIVYVTHDQGEALAMADRIIVMKDGKIEQIGSPDDIYYRPETEFVANFVSKANLIEGKWEEGGFIPKNSQLIWKDKNISEAIKRAGKYILRPEDIKISKVINNNLEGIIQTRQFQGSDYHYSIQLNNGDLIIVHSPISEKYEVNERVSIEPKI